MDGGPPPRWRTPGVGGETRHLGDRDSANAKFRENPGEPIRLGLMGVVVKRPQSLR